MGHRKRRRMKDVEKITTQLKNAQEFNHILSEYLNDNLKFGQKSPKEWKEYFYVKIPDEINFHTIVSLSRELFIKYQKAAALRDKETLQLTILEQSKDDKFNEAFQKAQDDHRSKYNKSLAAASCEIEGLLAIKDIQDAIANQKIARDFWVNTCKTLDTLRKLLESIGYALANDVRVNKDFNIRGDDS